MVNLKLKVCGMRDPANIMAVASLQPDFMGFIFFEGTPRFVGRNFMIPDGMPSGIKRVGVFVNERTDVILSKVRDHRLDYVQLHGGEPVAQCEEIKTHGVGVIKVFWVDDETRFEETRSFDSVADYFLFDTKGKFYGGNAKRFDWTVLARYNQQIPFFLSGGIMPEDVAGIQAMRGLNLAAIDVNSGVELQPGLKNIDKIKVIKTILGNNRKD